MSESEEFEKLTMLEGRLAAALDRIAVGLGEIRAAAPEAEDPGITSAALEDASLRAEAAEAQVVTLTERISALEARLDEAQSALAEAEAQGQQPVAGGPSAEDLLALEDLTAERDALMQQAQALEAAREADRDETNRSLSERDATIAQLQAELRQAETERTALAEQIAAAPPATVADPDADLEDLQEELEFARSRIRRLRLQRNEARAELDAARHAMDDMTTPSDEVDVRISSMRKEIAALRASNEDLIEQVARLRDEEQGKGTVVSEALLDEVTALRAARASEAAELERIMADLAPALSEGEQHG